MSMLVEAKVTVGNDHTPSQDTMDRANALKDEGNKLLQGGSPAFSWSASPGLLRLRDGHDPLGLK
jgi:hypothetical protein